MCFVLFPGLSSSGVQVLGECTVPGETCVIITSPVRVTRIPGVCPESTVLDVSPLESLSQPVTLLASVNRPASQEDMISNWEPTQFGGAAVSGAQIAPCLPTLAVARLPLCHQLGEDQSTAG